MRFLPIFNEKRHTFYGCNGLTGIDILKNVTSIGEYAFSGCSGLTSIEIPSSVVSIGRNVFYSCVDLKSITIKNSSCEIGVADTAGKYDADVTIPGTATIHGLAGSTAQKYAEKYARKFVIIGQDNNGMDTCFLVEKFFHLPHTDHIACIF